MVRRVYSARVRRVLLWTVGAIVLCAVAMTTIVLLPIGDQDSLWMSRWIPSKNIRSLEKQLSNTRMQLDDELIYVPQEELRAGFHTAHQTNEFAEETVVIDLGQVVPIEMVVMTPVYLRQNERLQVGYGFPKRFRIEASADLEFTDPITLADQTNGDFEVPGNYPVIYTTPGAEGRYVKLTITRLAGNNGVYFAALGEFLVISNNRNVALWRPLRVTSSVEADLRWSAAYLVDEFSILSAPVVDTPSENDGYLVRGDDQFPHSVVIDLGQVRAIDECRLYPAQPKNAPSAPGWGFPSRFRIELSRDKDFKESEILLAFETFDLRHWVDRPIIVPVGSRRYFTASSDDLTVEAMGEQSRFDPKGIHARYVKLTVLQSDERLSPSTFALAEFQVYAEGENVAVGKTLLNGENGEPIENSGLVDGATSRHRLIELSEWLRRLDRKRITERSAQLIKNQLTIATQAQSRAFLTLAAWVGPLATFTFGTLLYYQRHLLRSENKRLRDRIASDLHDDIGSNLGTIRLISQMLLHRSDCPETLRSDVEEISCIAAETSDSMRDMLWIIKAKPMTVKEFIGQLRQVAIRMLGHLDLQVSTPDEVPNLEVSVVWRRNVFLSMKEILHNLQRHSGAENVRIEIGIDRRQLQIEIIDDGTEFDLQSVSGGEGLRNIERRLNQVGGKCTYRSSPVRATHVLAPLSMAGQ